MQASARSSFCLWRANPGGKDPDKPVLAGRKRDRELGGRGMGRKTLFGRCGRPHDLRIGSVNCCVEAKWLEEPRHYQASSDYICACD